MKRITFLLLSIFSIFIFAAQRVVKILQENQVLKRLSIALRSPQILFQIY